MPLTPPTTAPHLFEARGLTKTHRLGKVEIPALRGVDLTIREGELAVIAGPSGSGKSTLLNLLGLLDDPDDRAGGSLAFAGRDVAGLGESERTIIRRRQLGFVFQSFNLVPVLTARENVEYPLWIDGVAKSERRKRAAELLGEVGLGHRLDHRPDQLSGGERQRVAIARALVHGPRALLADEPTGNLDSETAGQVVDLFLRFHREQGTTILLATHDPALVERTPRTIRLADGRVVEGGRP